MYLPISLSLDLGFQVHTRMPGFVHRWGRSNSDPHGYIGILSTSYLPILLDAILLVSTSFSLFKKVIFTYEPWLPVRVCFLMVEAPELYDYLSTFFFKANMVHVHIWNQLLPPRNSSWPFMTYCLYSSKYSRESSKISLLGVFPGFLCLQNFQTSSSSIWSQPLSCSLHGIAAWLFPFEANITHS